MNMLMRAALACAFLFAAPAFAKCEGPDSWRGQDKRLHFGGGAAIATLVTLHTRDPLMGFYAGAGAGVVKELVDAGGMGCASGKDLAVTVLGAALGAATGRVLITRIQGRTTVAYVTTF